MASDARGESSLGTVPATVAATTEQSTATDAVGIAAYRRRLDAATDDRAPCPGADAGDRFDAQPADGVATTLRGRGWVPDAPDWQWRVEGTTHARVATSCDGGACLVLGAAPPGEWSGHLETAALLERLDDVERYRAGDDLPRWAVTDSLLADATSVTHPARSSWYLWDARRDADDHVTITTGTGPMADRHPRVTFAPRPARDATRSPQAVRLELDGHPVRSYWARRLPALLDLLQGRRGAATDLCDVTDNVAAAWALHAVLDPRGGWCFTGTCHGTWRRGHPLQPVALVALTRTPGEVMVELCGDVPGVPAASYRTTLDALPARLPDVEAHTPGAPLPPWPGSHSTVWQCGLT